MNRFECVYTRAECHHQGDKCSECPITELVSDEFNECLDLSYQQGIADERPKAFAKGYDSGYQKGRADAIDEFANKMEKLVNKWFDSGVINVGDINKIAEQLKGAEECLAEKK